MKEFITSNRQFDLLSANRLSSVFSCTDSLLNAFYYAYYYAYFFGTEKFKRSRSY